MVYAVCMYHWIEQNEIVLALFIIVARMMDVSLGTMRTITVVRGYPTLAAVLGFGEILLWIAAASGVLAHVTLLKAVAYALGFSLGNVCGMMIERRIALGEQMVTIVSRERSPAIAFALRVAGFTVTEVPARGGAGEVALTMVIVPRRKTSLVLALAREVDPDVFTTFNDTRSAGPLIRHVTRVEPTGWRAWIKKK